MNSHGRPITGVPAGLRGGGGGQKSHAIKITELLRNVTGDIVLGRVLLRDLKNEKRNQVTRGWRK
jgi:hypothetical protein